MTYEEKSAWIMGVLAVGTYVAYVVIILGRAGATPLAEVSYTSTLLWTIGASIVGSIVLHAFAGGGTAKGADAKDQRDKDIYRFGEYTGRWFVVVGALVALGMAMAELDTFWIANVIYLGFVLSAILSSVLRIVAYRRGLPSW